MNIAASDSEQVILTIAIPTYNRAGYLDQCLDHICRQVREQDVPIELIVSNNNSEDETEAIVQKYLDAGAAIRYVKNAENVGPDRNAVQCFDLARGKYVLIIGDDDLLLEGALTQIVTTIRNGDYGVVNLGSYGFREDYLRERPGHSRHGVVVYTDLKKYFRRVHYWITFLSGSVVNKSLIRTTVDSAAFVGTNLPQLSWILTALFEAGKNACIENYSIAFKAANTGGYSLCRVFGANINTIFRAFEDKGANAELFHRVNRELVKTFFPNLILMQRKNAGSFSFESEDYFSTLRQVFGRYGAFWCFTAPVIKLPLSLASLWVKLCGKISSVVGNG